MRIAYRLVMGGCPGAGFCALRVGCLAPAGGHKDFLGEVSPSKVQKNGLRLPRDGVWLADWSPNNFSADGP
jgi:hypothetical protein